MARAAVPKLFERNPNLSLVNTSRLSSLLISAIYSFLTYLHYRQTQTSSGNTEYTQLQFGSPRREFFWLFAVLVWVSTYALRTTGLDKLTNRCVNCGETYFLTLGQRRDYNRLCLRFRKYPTFFTFCIDWAKHMQVCLEDMCNQPQFTILSSSYLLIISLTLNGKV